MSDLVHHHCISHSFDNDTWKYHSESVSKNGEIIFGRSNRTSVQLNNKVGYYALSEKLTGAEYTDMGNYISRYGIYQPDTLTLQGNAADPIFSVVDDEVMFGTLSMDAVLELIEWASDIHITKPQKSNLHLGVPSTRQVIEFQDRFLKDKSAFTGYDASEGALYVLFMLTLAMHPDVPGMFAIDSFDHANGYDYLLLIKISTDTLN